MKKHPNTSPPKQRGFSMIELMVGIALGLLAVMVIMKTSTLFQDQKNITSTGNNATESGLAATMIIRRAVQNAGAGFMYPQTLNCLGTAPARIREINGQSDEIVIAVNPVLNKSDDLPAQLTSAMPADKKSIVVNRSLGFSAGNHLMIINGTDPSKCAYAKISSITAEGSDTKLNIDGFRTKDGSVHPTYPKGSYVVNMGSGLLYNVFRIDDSKRALVMLTYKAPYPLAPTYDPNPGNLIKPAEYIASNIVDLQADYVVHTDGNAKNEVVYVCRPQNELCRPNGPTMNFSFDSLNGNATDIRRVRILRIGVVARSSKPTPSPTIEACYEGASGPCFGIEKASLNNQYEPYDLTRTLPTGQDWRNYRYKTYKIEVPLRNIIQGAEL